MIKSLKHFSVHYIPMLEAWSSQGAIFPTRGLGDQRPALEAQALLSTALEIVPTLLLAHQGISVLIWRLR